MSRSAFFRQRTGFTPTPVATLSLVLADVAASAVANAITVPDLVLANTETYSVIGGGVLDAIWSPAAARGSGFLRAHNVTGGVGEQQFMTSQFPAPFNALTNSWTFELWGRWTAWPNAVFAGQIIFGGLHDTSQDIRRSGWRISVCNGFTGPGVVVSFSPNDVLGATDDGFDYLTDPSLQPAKPRARFFTSPALAINNWYHFCIMWDANVATMYVFQDGALLGFWSPPITDTAPVFAQSRLINCNAVLLGRTHEYVSSSPTAQTFIDQARMSRGLRYSTAGFAVPAGVFSVD